MGQVAFLQNCNRENTGVTLEQSKASFTGSFFIPVGRVGKHRGQNSLS